WGAGRTCGDAGHGCSLGLSVMERWSCGCSPGTYPCICRIVCRTMSRREKVKGYSLGAGGQGLGIGGRTIDPIRTDPRPPTPDPFLLATDCCFLYSTCGGEISGPGTQHR